MTLVVSATAALVAAVTAVAFLFVSQAGGVHQAHHKRVGAYACKLAQYIEHSDGKGKRVGLAVAHFKEAEDAFGPGLGAWLVRHCADPESDPYFSVYGHG